MKVKDTITAKYTYTDLKLVSQNEGRVVLRGKRSDKDIKVVILGQRIIGKDIQQALASSSKKGYSVPQNENLQKLTQKAFVSDLLIDKSEELYYLMPLRIYKNTLESTLSSYSFSERLEIGFKIAKVVEYLHDEANISHGNIDLSAIILKKVDETAGYSVKLVPPLHPEIAKLAYRQKTLSVYRAPEKELTSKSDIWSLGVIFYELFTGKELSIKQELKADPKMLDHFEFGLSINDIKQIQIQKVLKAMLNRDPQDRPSIEHIKATLKNCVLRGLYGKQYIIPLIQEEKVCQKNERMERQSIKYYAKGKIQEERIILKQHVLVVKLIQGTRMSLSVHFRENFEAFISIEYFFSQLPQTIQKKFKNLASLYQELRKKDKKSIRFATDGTIVFYQMTA